MVIGNEFLKIIAYIPASLVSYYVMAYLLDIKKHWPYMIGMTALHIIVQLLYILGLYYQVPGIQSIKTISQSAIYLLAAFAFSKVSVGRKLLAFGLAHLAVLTGEVLSVLAFTQMGGIVSEHGVANALKDPLIYLFMQTINFVVVSLVGIAIIYIWNRYFLRTSRQSLWYFILFPFSQIVWLSICGYYAGHGVFARSTYITMIFGILISIAADMLILRGVKTFSERAVAEERASWYKTLLEQQSSYYEQILMDVEDASRIRHDIRNQLQTIYTLLQQGQNETAQKLLDEVSASLQHTRQYCANRVVNALLNVKAEQYERAGIALNCKCDVPEYLPLQGVELCSLFSNVLDNALNAARSSHSGEPVRMTAGLQKDYFILSCRNPYDSTAQKQHSSERHGLGLSILQDLAERHNGELKTEQAEDSFTTRIWLKLTENAEVPDLT